MKSPSVNFRPAIGGTSFVSRNTSALVQPLLFIAITFVVMTAGCAKNLSRGTAQEILVKFTPGVQTTQVSALESEAGIEQIKVIPELDVRVYRITSSKSVSDVIAICEKKPFVKYAEPNYKYEALK